MQKDTTVILLCGGQGSRMQASTPKQFLEIHHKPIVHYSLNVLKELEDVAEIVIVCHPDYRHLFPSSISSVPIHFASPGRERQDSVFNGFQAISKDSRYVCIHDSARPLITVALVKRVLAAAHEYGAAVAGMPVKFTIKERDEQLFVKNTPDRSKFWEIQTPQIIRTDWLKEGFTYVHQHKIQVTDDVSLVELLGHPVKLVEGSYTNIKITTPEDLLFVEHLLINHG